MKQDGRITGRGNGKKFILERKVKDYSHEEPSPVRFTDNRVKLHIKEAYTGDFY